MNLQEYAIVFSYSLFGVAALALATLALLWIEHGLTAPTSAQFRSIVRGAKA